MAAFGEEGIIKEGQRGGEGASLLLSSMLAGLPDFPSVTPLSANPHSSLLPSLTFPHSASSPFFNRSL